jgi:hypothetical protein
MGEDADPGHVPRWLGLSGERRHEESEGDEEPDAAARHGSPLLTASRITRVPPAAPSPL